MTIISATRWYKNYMGAKDRCNNKNHPGYKYYGGRGIKFFLTLREWKQLWDEDKGEELEHPSIDRIDNDGHYVFENCRFIEWGENSRRRHLGDKFSESHKRKISESLKGKPRYKSRKKIIQYSKDMEKIRVWDSIKEAAKAMNRNKSSIRSALCKGHKSAGFKWDYLKEGK